LLLLVFVAQSNKVYVNQLVLTGPAAAYYSCAAQRGQSASAASIW